MTNSESNNKSDTLDGEEIGYAAALGELEEILAELEADDVDVDVLSARVERAAQLISVCRERIRQADDQVSRIVAELEPSDPSP